MSDGNSTLNRRITKACFRTCSTCQSRSQAPLCLCTLRTITNRAEGTFGRLRYILGGDRPSQTTRLALSLTPIRGLRLELQYDKGGISPTTLQPPRGLLRSLPPILRMTNQSPMLGCSKGARGLSVLMRATGIFTGTTNSRCHSLRQRSDRYAIRAGRNLPDKEFRYLRTVIVTAAVHRGFSSELLKDCSPMTPPFNLPAPGRRQPLYVAFLA